MKDFEIGLKIKDESELYNAFDPNGEMLSADVLSYVQERFGEKNPGEKPILRIITTQEIDKERLQRAFDLQIDRMQIKLKSDEKKNTIKQLWMFLIGVVCISFAFMPPVGCPFCRGRSSRPLALSRYGKRQAFGS